MEALGPDRPRRRPASRDGARRTSSCPFGDRSISSSWPSSTRPRPCRRPRVDRSWPPCRDAGPVSPAGRWRRRHRGRRRHGSGSRSSTVTASCPDGTTVRWRSVGVDVAWDEPWRCAFMAWDDPRPPPGPHGRCRPRQRCHRASPGSTSTCPTRTRCWRWLGGPVPDGVNLSGRVGVPGPRTVLASPSGEMPIA